MSGHASLAVNSGDRHQFVDIGSGIRRFIADMNLRSGTIYVWCPHTTAAVTVNEKADPHVPEDMIHFLKKAVPEMPGFLHAEGNSAAHIMASLIGSGVLLMVENGAPVLGRWQTVFFCEFDGPRNRNVYLKVLSRED